MEAVSKYLCLVVFFAFVTKHQTKDRALESLGLINSETGILSTSSACRFPEVPLQTDLRLYEFTEAVKSGTLPKRDWFDFNSSARQGDEILFCIAFGFPHLGSWIDFEKRDIRVNPRAVYGDFMGKTLAGLHGVKITPDLDFDPDGLSGGGVFGAVLRHGRLRIVALGVTVCAGRSKLNFIGAETLRRYLLTI